MVEKRYGYRDICDGQACCQNCDRVTDFEDKDYPGIIFYYCPKQEGYVDKSGYCGLYYGFFLEKLPKRVRNVGNIEIIVGDRGYDC